MASIFFSSFEVLHLVYFTEGGRRGFAEKGIQWSSSFSTSAHLKRRYFHDRHCFVELYWYHAGKRVCRHGERSHGEAEGVTSMLI